MINLNLISSYDKLDKFSLVLALKFIELRIYTDIYETEKKIKSLEKYLKESQLHIHNLNISFDNKIIWFKEWFDERKVKLNDINLTYIEEMDIEDIVDIVSKNDDLFFKRNKIFKEVISTPLYVNEKGSIEKENTLELSAKKISTILGLKQKDIISIIRETN